MIITVQIIMNVTITRRMMIIKVIAGITFLIPCNFDFCLWIHKSFAHEVCKCLKRELHPNYIFLYFVLIGLEWDSINLFAKMNFFFFFQNSHFSTIYTRHIYDILFTNMNIF